jgi:hypothetical protein
MERLNNQLDLLDDLARKGGIATGASAEAQDIAGTQIRAGELHLEIDIWSGVEAPGLGIQPPVGPDEPPVP